MPAFLAKNGYRNIEGFDGYPFQEAFNTKQSLFDWYQDHPDNLRYFMKFLGEHRQTAWLETGLLDEIIDKQGEHDAELFVDVGGNIGNVCVDLRKKLPNLKGRVFNQDLPHAVSKTIIYPGVEQSPADFWVGQPIKGEEFR